MKENCLPLGSVVLFYTDLIFDPGIIRLAPLFDASDDGSDSGPLL